MKLKDIVKASRPQDLIAPCTMHNILSDITTMFAYAVEEYNDYVPRHPSSKLSAKLPDPDDDVDRSFPDEDLKIIVENLEYESKKPSRYWVPLLGLFTGARLNELCQLHLNDLQKIEGLDCISINIDDDTFKRVKNKPSRRTIPIHPKLKEYGFMEYVKQRQKEAGGGNEQLFPELTYRDASGYGRRLGDWFARYRKKIGVIVPNARGFHGFRHTFIRWAQNQAEMDDRELLELSGHENKSMSTVHLRYAHALPAKRLNTQLVKLDYGLTIPENPFIQDFKKEV